MLTTVWKTARVAGTTAMAAAMLMVFSACKIHVDKAKNGEEDKVDIQTPLGGIHVNKDVNARDTGLPVYPGAREKKKKDGGNNDNGQANVNIASGFFGLKIVVAEFLTDDPPEKVISYYRNQLKKYGGILECHTRKGKDDSPNVEVNTGHKNDGDKLACDENSGPVVELKVGTRDNQHVVSVSPQDGGQGSDFALVFVQARGERKDTI
jgi:hypothetical protein